MTQRPPPRPGQGSWGCQGPDPVFPQRITHGKTARKTRSRPGGASRSTDGNPGPRATLPLSPCPQAPAPRVPSDVSPRSGWSGTTAGPEFGDNSPHVWVEIHGKTGNGEREFHPGSAQGWETPEEEGQGCPCPQGRGTGLSLHPPSPERGRDSFPAVTPGFMAAVSCGKSFSCPAASARTPGAPCQRLGATESSRSVPCPLPGPLRHPKVSPPSRVRAGIRALPPPATLPRMAMPPRPLRAGRTGSR